MTRIEKLETAVRAGMRLRKAIDGFPEATYLEVSRKAVIEYDQVMKELSDASQTKSEPTVPPRTTVRGRNRIFRRVPPAQNLCAECGANIGLGCRHDPGCKNA